MPAVTYTSNVESATGVEGLLSEDAGVRPDLLVIRSMVDDILKNLNQPIHKISQLIHSHPETSFQEIYAHQILTEFLETQGHEVTRHAWGIDTAFEASAGSIGRQVIFCAEYDALPDIGHACGHNLIAASSIGAFLATAEVANRLGIPARVRILGTPAEEGGGGKAKMITAGAFDPPEDVTAAIMAHPVGTSMQRSGEESYAGLGGMRLIASAKMHIDFEGCTAHAAAQPWNGVNALDAAILAYNNISAMRQQIRPDERIHGVIEKGGTVPNVIPEHTRMNWYIRSPTMLGLERLIERTKACFQAAAMATGCGLKFDVADTYMDLRVNKTLCAVYVEEMAETGVKIKLEERKPIEASTDMGNVSYVVPSFHGAFVIPTSPDVSAHNPRFAACAGTDAAHAEAMKCAHGMAMMALRCLMDDYIAEEVRKDFANV